MSEPDQAAIDIADSLTDGMLGRLRADLAEMTEAVGAMSTLKPDMEIDVADPVGMALKVVAHVAAELAERDAEIERLTNQLVTERSSAIEKIEALRQRNRMPEELVTALRHALDMEPIGGPREKLLRDILAALEPKA